MTDPSCALLSKQFHPLQKCYHLDITPHSGVLFYAVHGADNANATEEVVVALKAIPSNAGEDARIFRL
ncbi:hypothetical protein PsorP6_005723 [Peronosclerospora sorghi]|uniref:Uncharacterized protein n=1 Tax=Peronosclerospora sorghi TaxID=230839 RepID=A0ACC0W5I5_9STRA|nr:hypothetical protein PsorP6_005723 [Peronosclerospora sorghi]